MPTAGIIAAWTVIAGAFTYKAGSVEDAEKRYGKLYRDYTWEEKGKYLYTADLSQFSPVLHNVTVNKEVLLPLVLVLAELKYRGLVDEITEFQGCYSPRAIAGTSRPSTHAYGLGCDFNNGTFTEDFVSVWKSYGWCWGGDFKNNFDPMHFSYSWECKPD